MKTLLFTLTLAFASAVSLFAQDKTPARIDPTNIDIYRDTLGVPHIFAPTDAEVAYGLAWVQCEDQYEYVQEAMLNARRRLGRVKGKEGAILDFFVHLTRMDTVVAQRYETAFSPEFKRVLAGFAQGLNDYAAAHPRRVIDKKIYPISPQDIVLGYAVPTVLNAGLGFAFKSILDDQLETLNVNHIEGGSNASVVAPSRTPDGSTYFMSNSHQPNTGRFAWYEVHVHSDEGWHFHGATFPGAVTPFVGTNENLSWTHTNNYHAFGDVYELNMHPKKKHTYRLDDEWHKLEVDRVWLKVKVLGPIKLPVPRKLYVSKHHGPVYKHNDKYYAFRYPALKELRCPEQWYRMNKARNLDEFKAALDMYALTLYNTVYADKTGNIALWSEGIIPNRDPKLNWHYPLPGDSSAYIWNWNDRLPHAKLVHKINPDCGYLWNANNTPLNCTCAEENPTHDWPGVQTFNYNRGDRFTRMFKQFDGEEISWEDYKAMKYDKCYDQEGTYMKAFGPLYDMDPEAHPKISDALVHIQNWGLCGEVHDEHAALGTLIHHYVYKATNQKLALWMIKQDPVPEPVLAQAVAKAKDFLMDRYGKLNVRLGDFQKHLRGSLSLPLGGMREVPFAIHEKVDERRGIAINRGGETFVQFTKWKDGQPEIYSSNTHGVSAEADSPHYTDQMQAFVNEKVRRVYLDVAKIKEIAVEKYHPVKCEE